MLQLFQNLETGSTEVTLLVAYRKMNLPSFEASPNSLPDCLPSLYFCKKVWNIYSKKLEEYQNRSKFHEGKTNINNRIKEKRKTIQENGPGDDSSNEIESIP